MGNCKSVAQNEWAGHQHMSSLVNDKFDESSILIFQKNDNENNDDDSFLSLGYSGVSFLTLESALFTCKNSTYDEMSLKPHSSLVNTARLNNSLIKNDMRFYYDDTHCIVTGKSDTEEERGEASFKKVQVTYDEHFQENTDRDKPEDESPSNRNQYRCRGTIIDLDESISETIDSLVENTHPLHLAIIRGDSEIVVLQLLESEPDALYLKTKNGKVALDLAKESKHNNRESIMDLLLHFDSNFKLYQCQNNAIALSEQIEITEMSLESLSKRECDAEEEKVGSPIKSKNYGEKGTGFYTYSESRNRDDFRSFMNIDDNESDELKRLRCENEQLMTEMSELKTALHILSASMNTLKGRQDSLVEDIIALKETQSDLCTI